MELMILQKAHKYFHKLLYTTLHISNVDDDADDDDNL